MYIKVDIIITFEREKSHYDYTLYTPYIWITYLYQCVFIYQKIKILIKREWKTLSYPHNLLAILAFPIRPQQSTI